MEENEIKSVSVVMAAYNGERFIREQLDSILAQSYPIMELIVQDDCSTDSTLQIVRESDVEDWCVPFHNKYNTNIKNHFNV